MAQEERFFVYIYLIVGTCPSMWAPVLVKDYYSHEDKNYKTTCHRHDVKMNNVVSTLSFGQAVLYCCRATHQTTHLACSSNI